MAQMLEDSDCLVVRDRNGVRDTSTIAWGLFGHEGWEKTEESQMTELG